MNTISHYIRRILGTQGYRKVQQTFDMRWTNRYNFAFASLNEAIVRTLAAGEKGGIVVYSANVSAQASVANAILMAVDKALASKPSGITVGNLFKGRYKSPSGQVYDEKSLAVEVLFINGRQLIELATRLAREFRQETVLAKDSATNEIYLVDGN